MVSGSHYAVTPLPSTRLPLLPSSFYDLRYPEGAPLPALSLSEESLPKGSEPKQGRNPKHLSSSHCEEPYQMRGDVTIPGEATEPLPFLSVTHEIASRRGCSR